MSQARRNACNHVAIGVNFESDWLPVLARVFLSQSRCEGKKDGVGNCTLHLLILNISDFVYLLHNQTACMQHVSYRPIYGAVPRAYKET